MERQIPHNIEAEQGVLGSIVIDPNALDQVIRFLHPEDFYRDAHRLIYEAVIQVNARGTPADFLTLCDELERTGCLEQVGGTSYLTSLIAVVPTSGNIEYYGRIVERASILRQLIHAAGNIAAAAYTYQEADVSGALSQAEKLVFELSQRHLMGVASDISISELMTEYLHILENRYQNRGQLAGISTGYTELNRLLSGFHRSDLIILAARPSAGKTALMLNLAFNAAHCGHRVGIFSLEMSKEQLAQRLIAMEARIEQQKLRAGRLDDEDWARLIHATDHLAELGIYLDDMPGLSLMQLRSRAREWVLQRGVQMIMVDYLQLLTTGGENRRYENRVQEVSLISRALKALARELNIPVLALSQLSRAVENRQVKVPQLSDLRESGGLEQDADVVLFIYRDVVYNEQTEHPNQADILVAKQRNGPIGNVSLYFNQSEGRFHNMKTTNDKDKGQEEKI